MKIVPALITENQQRWDSMHLKADRIKSFDFIARHLVWGKDRYMAIEKTTGVPWFIIALVHYREADGFFDRQLGQGDTLHLKSTHDPAGRGPFLPLPGDTPEHGPFYRSAIDALCYCHPYAARWENWTAGGSMTLLEEYNGLGYAERGVPSAYVWSGTDQYVSGKFVADHVYRKSAVDVQVGCAPLLSRMMALDATIRFAEEEGTWNRPKVS